MFFSRMENDSPGPSLGGGKPDWFLGWLREVFLPVEAKDPLSSQLEVFQDAVEKLPDIEDSVKKTLTNMFTNEARINLAREDDKNAISQLIKSQKLPGDKQTVQMPWQQLTEVETKIVAKTIESLKELDFSTKSLKYWKSHFNNLFDKFFVTFRVRKIAVVFNSSSLSLKQQLLMLDTGTDTQADTYSYLNLLQLIMTLVHSPDSPDQAMMEIFKGMDQMGSETVQTFLQQWRDLAEDTYGPNSGGTMSQTSLLLKKICEGLSSTELSKLTATIVITLPFQWATMVDSIIQFQQRVQNIQPPQNVNAIQQKEYKPPTCYKCSGAHMIRNCKVLFCRYCGGPHKNISCSMNGKTTYCCKSKYHNSEGHYKHFPSNKAPRRSDINLIEATSFVEGAISMDRECTGTNFVDAKLLIDTGAMIPSGV